MEEEKRAIEGRPLPRKNGHAAFYERAWFLESLDSHWEKREGIIHSGLVCRQETPSPPLSLIDERTTMEEEEEEEAMDRNFHGYLHPAINIHDNPPLVSLSHFQNIRNPRWIFKRNISFRLIDSLLPPYNSLHVSRKGPISRSLFPFFFSFNFERTGVRTVAPFLEKLIDEIILRGFCSTTMIPVGCRDYLTPNSNS